MVARTGALAASCAVLFIFPSTGPASGQGPVTVDPAAQAPRVYVDCRGCDMTYIQREVTFVSYVREADAADVHVLVTDQQTGGGGRRFTLAFIGRGPYAGVDNSIDYTSVQSNTSAQERDGVTETLRLGLVPYVARTSLASQVQVRFTPVESGQPVQVTDPWNSWTFEVYGGGNFNMETSQSSWSARYGFYANRVTEMWKVQFRPYFNHNGRTIERDNGEDINIEQWRHGLETHLIRSVGDHMGVGLFASYNTATVENLNHGVSVRPAIEYSLFPYAESSRRQVTVSYRAGYEYADYIEETIYEKTEEGLLSHSLNASVQFRQPWGNISSSLTGSSYLHNIDYHRVAFNGNVSLRLGRGISLNFGGNYQRINDQLALPRGDASLEDILLQRRQLATSYRTSGNIGLSYSFGSIFSNVVNPRL